jgi:hypothetical protein
MSSAAERRPSTERWIADERHDAAPEDQARARRRCRRGAGRLFAAIEQTAPEGVRHASCKSADGETYVVLPELEDAEENALASIPSSAPSRRISPHG